MRTLSPELAATLAAAPDRWINSKQAALLLSVGMRTLWRLIEKKKIPAPIRFGRKLVRFDRAALIEHLRRRSGLPVGGEVFVRDFKTGQEEFYRPNCNRPVFTEAS